MSSRVDPIFGSFQGRSQHLFGSFKGHLADEEALKATAMRSLPVATLLAVAAEDPTQLWGTPQNGGGASCAAHPACAGLVGDCCPTWDPR